jgi:predicted MPP superfamily phosphohydrolase
MSARFLIVLIAVPTLVLLSGVLWSNSASRAIRNAGGPQWLRRTPKIYVYAVVSSLLLLILAGVPTLPTPPAFLDKIAGTLGLPGGLIILLSLLPTLSARGWTALQRRFNKPPTDEPHATPRQPDTSLSRRQIMQAGLWNAPALLGLGSALVAHQQLEDFQISKIDLTIDKQPLPNGLNILHISDLHVGRFTRGAILERIVQASADLQPDLIAFTGDLINHHLNDLPAGIELLLGLQRIAPTFVCEGNHDLFQSAKIFRNSLTNAGIPLLLDESTVIQVRSTALRICGATWNGNDGPTHLDRLSMESNLAHRIPRLLDSGHANLPTILLAHHPHAADYAPHSDLTLAGHTHGGQLMLSSTRGPGPMLYRYWSGLHTSRQLGRPVIVSNGVGNWFPLRTAAPAEITLITVV